MVKQEEIRLGRADWAYYSYSSCWCGALRALADIFARKKCTMHSFCFLGERCQFSSLPKIQTLCGYPFQQSFLIGIQ